MFRLKLLSAALLLATASFAASAAERPLETRYGLGEAEFRAAHAQMLDQGLRLIDITVAELNGKPVIGAVWQRFEGEPGGSPERSKRLQSLLFLKQTQEELVATGRRLSPEGSKLEVIDAYVSNGKPVFAALFSPPNEPVVATVGVFLTSEQVADMRAQAQEKDYELRNVEVYVDGDRHLYLPAFVPRIGSEIDGVDAETTLQFQAGRAKMNLLQLQPLSICSYDNGEGRAWYSGMFEKAGASRDVVVGESLEAFRATIEPVLAKGGMVLDLDSHAANGQVSYSAVFQR